MSKVAVIKQLRTEGKTFEYIGRLFGCSRQNIHKIIKLDNKPKLQRINHVNPVKTDLPCKVCGRVDIKRPPYRKHYCSSCYNQRIFLRGQKRRLDNPRQYMWQHSLLRTILLDRPGFHHTIKPEDIVIPKLCPVLGIPMGYNLEYGDRPSLDRKDPSRGYEPDNIWVISLRANSMKNTMPFDIFIKKLPEIQLKYKKLISARAYNLRNTKKSLDELFIKG